MYTREEILDKMKRSIKENGGKALGKRRFSDKSGIPIYEIEGKFWAKYSDLVSEAGASPNEPYRKYPEGFLEEKVVLLIRGGSIPNDKFPTLNELRVVHTHNPDFPFRAIKRRWSHFVSDLVRYCEKNPGHDDILEICRPKFEKLGEGEKDDDSNNSSSNVGIVYLYKRGKYYKVGHTKDPVRRGREIRLETPDTLRLIYSFKTDDPSGLEDYWKKRFKDRRWKETEFFSLNSQDIKAFKRWKKLY